MALGVRQKGVLSTSSLLATPYPAALTAPSSSSNGSPGSCSASSLPAAKFTVALDTPGRAETVLSTVAAQLAQSIPSTRTTVRSRTPTAASPSGASGLASRVLGVAAVGTAVGIAV